MKTKTTLFILFLFSNFVLAQNEKKRQHTFSINANYALDQLMARGDDNSIYEIQPDHEIMLQYKIGGKASVTRFGLSILNRKKIEPPQIGALSSATKKLEGISFQMGFQKIKNVWGKWNFIYGADILYKHHVFKYELENQFAESTYRSKLKRNAAGLSGFLGVQINLTERISLSTELALTASRIYNSLDENDLVFFVNPLVNELDNEQKVTEIEMSPPLVLFVNYQF